MEDEDCLSWLVKPYRSSRGNSAVILYTAKVS